MDSQQNTLTIEEKQAYVNRIDKKATDENISIKHASQKLGCKVWSYYNYKADIKQSKLKADALAKSDKLSEPVAITISVSDSCMCYLEQQAYKYATNAEFVAQLLLHECINLKLKEGK